MAKKICASKFSVETLSLFVLGLILFIRYPIHFIASPPFLMDFEVYRTIAHRLLNGQGAALYMPTTSEEMIFKYGPPWALVSMPLGWLPPHAGAILWTSLNLAALMVTLVWCARLCRHCGIHSHPLTLVAAVFLILRPLGEEMGNGQVNLLWGCLTTGCVYAHVRGRPWLSAAALAAAILLKLPAIIFLPYLILQRQWSPLIRTVALIGASTLAASLLIAPAQPLHLMNAWTDALYLNGTTLAFRIGNQSVLALLARFLTDDGYGLNIVSLSRPMITWIAAAFTILATAALGRSRLTRQRSPQRWLFDSAILTVLMVICSPSAWLATYTALLFPAFVAMAALFHQWARRERDAWSLLLAGVVVGCSLLTHRKVWALTPIRHWHGETYLYLVFTILPWMGLALYGLLVRQRQTAR